MMRLPPFTYLAPANLRQAVQMLTDHGPEALPVAGGTDLYPNMKRRLFTPRYVVGLRRLEELHQVRRTEGGGLSIGAGVTLDELASSREVLAHCPALTTAAGLISTPQLRHMGTIGGNLCLDTRCNYYNQSLFWRQALGCCMKKDGDICKVAPGSPICLAVHSADTVPVLLAHRASVRLLSHRGERTLSLGQLYRDDGMHFITFEQGELLTEIMLPPANGLRSVYYKLRDRGAFDFPIAGVCAAVALDQEGICGEARVVVTGITPAPLELTELTELLVGQRLTPPLIDQVARLAYRLVKPVDNTSGTISQRKETVRVFVARALMALASPGH